MTAVSPRSRWTHDGGGPDASRAQFFVSAGEAQRQLVAPVRDSDRGATAAWPVAPSRAPPLRQPTRARTAAGGIRRE
jgi:hypothetical protein